MKAILLAAGFGTRLRPLTNNIPKCLVPIKGKPLLEIWLENLTNSGINQILINTHYLSKKVDSFVKNSPYLNCCIIKYEKVLLGTAGTLLSNINFIANEDCILLHADNYCLESITELINAHVNRPKNCLITMMTFRTDNPSSCGIVEIDEQNVVVGFHEKTSNPPGNLANGAIYIISQDLIELLKNNYNYVTNFSEEVLNKLLGKIYTYETKQTFIDIGTPSSYFKANNLEDDFF